MKILMIEIGGWGGICHYTYNLCQALSAVPGVEPVLLTDADYELDGLPRSFRIIKAPLRGRPYFPAVAAVRAAIKAENPGVIHVQTLISARKDWLFFLLGNISGRTIVFTAHNVLPHEEFEQRAFLMKESFGCIYRNCTAVIVHSGYSQQRLCAMSGIAPDKVRVIPHGNYLFARRCADRAESRRVLGIAQDRMVALCFGAIRKYKGIDTLIGAFAQVRRALPEALLLVAGMPMHVDIERYRRQAAEQGEGVVICPGYFSFEEIGRFFSASDAVVFPYRHIDMSGSLQLAYAYAKPVVAFNTGGIGEVIRDGVNGLLVPEGDTAALARAVARALRPEEAAAMGAASLAMAENEFSWEAIAAKTRHVYEEVR